MVVVVVVVVVAFGWWWWVVARLWRLVGWGNEGGMGYAVRKLGELGAWLVVRKLDATAPNPLLSPSYAIGGPSPLLSSYSSRSAAHATSFASVEA